eukprot:COSAG02_NODE_331_length_24480_cov_22.114720_9_plen_520_part_00
MRQGFPYGYFLRHAPYACRARAGCQQGGVHTHAACAAGHSSMAPRALLLLGMLLLYGGGSQALDPRLNRGRDKVHADFALSIAGMTTPHCATRVREALKAVRGVKIAEVMLPGSALIVGECNRDDLLKAVASAGEFEATVVAEKNAEGGQPAPPVADDAQRVSEAYSTDAGRASLITDTNFAGSAVVELSDTNFRNIVAFGDDLWLVFFYFHDGCPLCYLRGEEIKKAAKILQGTGMRVGAVDVDQKGSAKGVAERMRVTGTDLKNLGAKEQREGLPRPGPAPLIKVFDTPQKITARRGIYDAPDLENVPIKADLIVEWATKTLLAGRTAEQLAEELSQGQPLLGTVADWEGAKNSLQNFSLTASFERFHVLLRSQIHEGKPTPLLISCTCLVMYIVLSFGLQFSVLSNRRANSKLVEQRKKDREIFEQKEREAMASARAKLAQERVKAQARREQEAADARVQKKAEAARKKQALSEGRRNAVASMQSAADRRATMQEKIQKMSKTSQHPQLDSGGVEE